MRGGILKSARSQLSKGSRSSNRRRIQRLPNLPNAFGPHGILEFVEPKALFLPWLTEKIKQRANDGLRERDQFFIIYQVHICTKQRLPMSNQPCLLIDVMLNGLQISGVMLHRAKPRGVYRPSDISPCTSSDNYFRSRKHSFDKPKIEEVIWSLVC